MRRILVYRIGLLGDTIIALPAFWAIRNFFKNSYLCLLSDSHSNSSYISSVEILPKKGLFDEFITYEACIRGYNYKYSLKLFNKLRNKNFDTLVYLAPRLRKKIQIYRDLIFFKLVGINQFIGHRGFEHLPRRILGSQLPITEHEADHLLKRIAKSGIPVSLNKNVCMDLSLTEFEINKAKEWLNINIPPNNKGPLIAIGPGSKWLSKRWPEDRYEKLGQYLIEKYGVFPVVFGGIDEKELGNRLINAWGKGANAAGELNVREAAAALSFCRLYIGNDNGTMHLAAAVGTQCVAIFSAQDWPGRWYPYGNHHVVIRRSVPCEGCRLTECIKHDMICLKKIRLEDLILACNKLLGEGTSL